MKGVPHSYSAWCVYGLTQKNKESQQVLQLYTNGEQSSAYVKSLNTASIKLGADMRMVKVQMMEKSEKATRHSRSTTAAANFHSLQMASPSSCSRKRLAMYCTSSRIWEISGSCSSSSSRVCSEWTSCWEEPPALHSTTLGSEPCGNVRLSAAIAW